MWSSVFVYSCSVRGILLCHIVPVLTVLLAVTTSGFGFALIVLGGFITGSPFSVFLVHDDSGFSYAALGITTGIFTIFTLPVMLYPYKRCFIFMIAFEIGWIWFLLIFWTATGFTATTYNSNFVVSCSDIDPNEFIIQGVGSNLMDACNQSVVLLVFAFLGWSFLLIYNSILSILTIRQCLRGNTGIWSKEVRDADFTAPPVNHNLQIVFEH